MSPFARSRTPLDRRSRTNSWIAQIIAAAIFATTLPAKFGGAPDSVALFSTLGVEPYGRIGLGVFEALAVVLLLVPRTASLGGLLTMGLLSGAVLAHLTVLGIAIEGDPSLFAMAVVGLVAGAVVTWLRRRELPVIGCRFGGCATEPGSSRTTA